LCTGHTIAADTRDHAVTRQRAVMIRASPRAACCPSLRTRSTPRSC